MNRTSRPPADGRRAGGGFVDVYLTTHQGVYDDAPEAAAFEEAYRTATGADPESVSAALGFDGINLMADAMGRAGDLAGDKMRDALAAATGVMGATGEISYVAPSRIPSKSVALVQGVDGEIDVKFTRAKSLNNDLQNLIASIDALVVALGGFRRTPTRPSTSRFASTARRCCRGRLGSSVSRWPRAGRRCRAGR